MYYIVYGFLYLLSLLPFWFLYVISDILCFFVYYLGGYRKDVVMRNLTIAFPEMTKRERERIAKEFYHNLIDAFVESIKLLSISDKEFIKRCSANFDIINTLIEKGKNIQLQPGHQFNVEFYNLLFSRQLKSVRFIFMYMPFSSDSINNVFNKLRMKYGSILLAATKFREEKNKLAGGQYAITLGADQNPGSMHSAYWMNFFNKPAPFIPGPARNAVKHNSAIVFVEFIKVKRGYFRFENILLTDDASLYSPEELTRKYRDFIEEAIRRQPANYLWTHKRWKHTMTVESSNLWIDD